MLLRLSARIAGRTVDVHIHWLRKKIENNLSHPRIILTVGGVGYRFIPKTCVSDHFLIYFK